MNFSFKFVCVVWGKDYTDTFLKISLPSQLLPGNMVYVVNNSDAAYRIYTTAKYAEIIRRSAAYKKLSDLMPVEMAIIENIFFINKYMVNTQCQVHFIESNAENDCAFFFTQPDEIWADGAFKRVLEIAKSGKRAVAFTGLRLAKETFVPAFLKQYSKDGVLQPVTPRQLVKIAMDHLHPETKELYWESKNSSTFPSYLFWPVKQEGLLMRQFYQYPFMVRPIIKKAVPTAIDSDYVNKAGLSLDDIYIVQDTDEFCQVDVTSINHRQEAITSGQKTVEGLAEWAKVHTNTFHREFVKKKVRFHWKDISGNLRGVEKKSDEVIEDILSLLGSSNGAASKESKIEEKYIAPGGVDPSNIPSRLRFLSPRFVARKILLYGGVGVIKKICFSLVQSIAHKIFGGEVKIKIVKNFHVGP